LSTALLGETDAAAILRACGAALLAHAG
jgi:hypothetical protein